MYLRWLGLQTGQEEKRLVLLLLSSLYVVSFCWTTTNKIIDEHLDKKACECNIIQSMRAIW